MIAKPRAAGKTSGTARALCRVDRYTDTTAQAPGIDAAVKGRVAHDAVAPFHLARNNWATVAEEMRGTSYRAALGHLGTPFLVGLPEVNGEAGRKREPAIQVVEQV
jgi:hypothetical protein